MTLVVQCVLGVRLGLRTGGRGVVSIGSIDYHEHFFNVGRVWDNNGVCVDCGIDGDDDWMCVGCVCFRLMIGDDFF